MSESMTEEQSLGLRARKRAATTAAIERAALDLSLEHGYDSVTVDMICAASSVSPRTFFNYFGSKEGAVLGAGASEPSDDERAAFLSSTNPDVLADLVTLLASVLADHDQDRDAFASRRALVIANPSLMTKQLARIGEQESKLTELVVLRLDEQRRTEDGTAALEGEAGMIVALAASVLRFSARRRLAGSSEGTSALEVVRADLALARQVIRADAATPRR